MYIFRLIFLLLMLFYFSSPGLAQKAPVPNTELVGGPCEGCEAIFEFGDRILSSTDTLPNYGDWNPKIKITGTIYKSDGKAPAEGVILYVYHTDEKGVYPKKGDEEGWAGRHGYIRGWIKTGGDGKYTFYTSMPGSYSSNPAHIHPTILEPNGKYYWIDESFFKDDPNLDEGHQARDPRGGAGGILTLKQEDDLWVGNRDIILGKNIPNYE